MNKCVKWVTTGVVAIIFCLFISQAAFAQVGNPGGSLDSPAIPIDGGASVLAAAGVAYGGKKYRDYRKGSAEEETED